MLLLLLVFVCAGASALAQSPPSVNTAQGTVIGAYDSNGTISFYGLYYAGTTSGVNRFKPPTPPPSYPGPYHAIDNGVVCAQQSSRGLIGVEDCLVLDIHTKSLNSTNPVIVLIEGENYDTTTSVSYSYESIVKENTVLVSVKYRLSIFGFLCLGVPEAPGNVGLRDIVQALQWIQNNIAGFGGDPNNVVLLGHGSGAAMVDLITLSPLANRLVHKAIVLSGSALAPWAVAYDSIDYAEAVAANLGYTDKSRRELANLLAKTDLNILSNALTGFEFYNNTPLFAPCVENVNLNPNDTFLPNAPINILKSGNYSHIPYMAGYVDREGSVRVGEAAFGGWLNKMQSNFTDFLPADLQFESASNKSAVAQTIRQFYFDQRAINMETIEDYLDYYGDTLTMLSVMKGAKERALTSTAGVRLFEFAYRRGHDPEWLYPQITLDGVRHGGILDYILDNNNVPVPNEDAKKNVLRRILYFARTGTQGGYPDYVMWETVTSSTLHMLLISGGDVQGNTTVYGEGAQINLHSERTTFWNRIYDTHYRTPTHVSGADTSSSFALMILVGLLFTKFL